ncbi:prolyl 3-hydroxylase OGFOD1 [Diachasma alloeum]|uniref:prolyl 3-hydroxylase OGFOD1 n=1 Tax=Diachasma alloeum TaxID=454923 RepID=UPI00073832EE|nr:prolyl 3-hydroxylase OGFOD1 [Diachasma alloeum]XP_015109468.1 prolyl 3-hydroxylase OGFOD1 [Diachasma alloeum]
MTEDEPKRKKLKSSILSESLTTEDFQSLFRTHWQASTPLNSPSLEVIATPFRVCKISNFLNSENFLEKLITELSDIETRRPETDLYSFEQTSDLANVDTEKIVQLHQLFQNELRNWMQTNTGIELNTKISMSSTAYSDTDYLLCHDDHLGDRRIAFILYLSKNWTPEDGGSLDLFDTDSSGLPRKIVRSLVPEYNSLVFFEVSDNTYHQVAEVTSPDKRRLTINGWFHGPISPSTRPPRPEIEASEFHEPSAIAEDLSFWVVESYLCEGIKKGIQREVEKKSYTYLTHFLREEVYNKISAEIMSEEIKWIRMGPPDSRNYEVADEESLPSTLKQFYEMFKSIEMFKLLKEYTELDLVPDGKDMRPKMVIQLQRWTKGCYTLLYDKEDEENLVSCEKAEDDDLSNPNYCSKSEEEFAEVEEHENGMNKLENGGRERKGSSSSCENPEEEKEKFMRRKKRRIRKNEPNSSTTSDVAGEEERGTFPLDSHDSQGSDVRKIRSPSDSSGNDEGSGDETDESDAGPGTLDVIMQFNTSRVPEDVTIDYVDPKEPDGAFIHVPPEDNHLCLVYRTMDTSRVHKYVNHYCEGYFYNLMCSYLE